MTKTADIYYKLNPWKVIEEGFDKNRNRVSESIFSLGNEYMGDYLLLRIHTMPLLFLL